MQISTYFDLYAVQGLKVIPLKPYSKIPVAKNWNKHWSEDWNREYIQNNTNCNIGLLLGTVMDVEGDTVKANKLLLKLTEGYPHPMYSSAKSIHHLFLSPDPKTRIIKFQGIEFRGQNHQSVLPPSKHKNGDVYKWISESRFPIPKMPYSLLSLFKKAKLRKHNLIKPGHMQTYCGKCFNSIYIHKKRFDLELEVFKRSNLKWMCQNCREIDVREACRKIR